MVLLLFFNSAYRRRGSVTKYSAPREGRREADEL